MCQLRGVTTRVLGVGRATMAGRAPCGRKVVATVENRSLSVELDGAVTRDVNIFRMVEEALAVQRRVLAETHQVSF